VNVRISHPKKIQADPHDDAEQHDGAVEAALAREPAQCFDRVKLAPIGH
jgi:hypothetical protein